MDNEELIEILNYHFVRELEATMIYTRNSFIMKPCDPSRVSEAISVDEMRHMWWLAELIVNRGGKPTMEHKELDFGGDDLKSQLERQIDLESEGIDLYQEHIDSIHDEEVVGVLKHILDEEKRHRKEFRMRLQKLENI
ncbi:MAG: ferritin-like domain-containing protein [Methanobacterium sp.]